MSEEQKPVGDEPKPVKAKRKPQRKELTPREVKFLEARLSGKTLKDSAIAAGLAPYRESGFQAEQRIREKTPEIFNAAGVPVARIAAKVNELLDKKKKLYYTNLLLDSKEVDDTAAQTAALHLASRVHGIDKLQVEMSGEVKHTHTMDFSDATEEEVNAFLRACAPLRRRLPEGTGQTISVEPSSVATGD